MAEPTLSINHPTPQASPPAPHLADLDQVVTDLRRAASSAYLGLLGIEAVTRDSVPPAGAFEGIIDQARSAWSLALDAERITETLVAATNDRRQS